MVYAKDTSVPAEKSRAEIEKILLRYGADDFGYRIRRGVAAIQFEAHDRTIRFTLALPDPDDAAFTRTPTRQVRSATSAKAAYEQAARQKWRALALVVKAKLEAVESGIVTFEQEFLPHIILPGGHTVFEATAATIAAQYDSGQPGPLLQIEGVRP